MEMEIVEEINQYCGKTKDGFVVLKDSGVVVGKLSPSGYSLNILDRSDVHQLLDQGIKISGNMPNSYSSFGINQIDWFKKQHALALKSDYPLFDRQRGGTYTGKFELDKYKTSEYFQVGDIKLALIFYDDGTLRIISQGKYRQYGNFKVINISGVTFNDKYMNNSQCIDLSISTCKDLKLSVEITLEIDYAFFVNQKATYNQITDFKAESLNLQKPQPLVPLMKNILQFCDIQKLNVDKDSLKQKYQDELTKCNSTISQMTDLLKDYKIPVSAELLAKQAELTDIIEQVDKFDSDLEYQKLKNFFIDQLIEITICNDTRPILKSLRETSFSAENTKILVNELLSKILG